MDDIVLSEKNAFDDQVGALNGLYAALQAPAPVSKGEIKHVEPPLKEVGECFYGQRLGQH